MVDKHEPGRSRKFRQAAIVYLHVAVLYQLSAYVLLQQDLFPSTRGPAWAWFVLGTAITLAVVLGLWYWQNVWFARAIWGLHALRLPTLIKGAFIEGAAAAIEPRFYLAAGIVVLVNLWMLARAAWDV